MSKDSNTLIVERHSFYNGTGNRNKTLRYSEYWPPKPHEDHDICGCTKEVCERPGGIPDQITQDIKLLGDGWSFSLWQDPWLTFRAGEPDPHAYFIFGKKEKSIKIEVTEPYTMSNFDDLVFLGKVFLGNEIDISKLMNGHSLSKIIDLSKIKSDDLWAHECNFGDEAYAFMRDCPDEIELWRDVIEKEYLLRKNIDLYLNERDLSVEDVYRQVEQQSFLDLAEKIKTKLEPYSTLEAIGKTEIFKVTKILKIEAGKLKTMKVALA